MFERFFRRTEDDLEKGFIRVCPHCKSINVVQDKSTLQQTGALPTLYLCRRCGHSGFNFPEVHSYELKEFESDVDKANARDVSADKSEKVDVSYGNFEVHILWKFTGPALLTIAIMLLLQRLFVYGSILMFFGLFMIYVAYVKKFKLAD